MCKKILAVMVAILTLSALVFPQYALAYTAVQPALQVDLINHELENGFIRKRENEIEIESDSLVLLHNNSVIGFNSPVNQSRNYSSSERYTKQLSEFDVIVTAYSSTVDQCDSTPFITASNTHVHDGTIACNFLPFGTKVIFPKKFGNKVFTVEDRMRDSWKIDIWFETRQEALQFGKKTLEAVVVE